MGMIRTLVLYFHCLCKRKVIRSNMAREISRFVMSLGIGELQLYCDNEPRMLQVLALTQRALMNCGLKVTTNTSKPQDHGSNALVEQTVHRVRQMAMTLIYQLNLTWGMFCPSCIPCAVGHSGTQLGF